MAHQMDLFSEINKTNKQNVNLLKGNYLFFDTETTGLPKNWNASVNDFGNWPRLVQLAWVFYIDGNLIESKDYIIKPEGFKIPEDSSKIHGITHEIAEKQGALLKIVLNDFASNITKADYLVAHNMSFDQMIMGAEFLRNGLPNHFDVKKTICTKEASTNFCAIPSNNSFKKFKWPKLSELHIKLFGHDFDDSHNALVDVTATAKCFFEMKNKGII
jgi:DNA polymerase III epsilon subunit-like protein